MNTEEFRQWQDAVLEYSKMRDTIINDRKSLIKLIEEHLHNFFDYDDIEIDLEFNKIKLYWKYPTDPIITIKTIHDLNMDFSMSNCFRKDLGQCNTVELYPFGIEEGIFEE